MLQAIDKYFRAYANDIMSSIGIEGGTLHEHSNHEVFDHIVAYVPAYASDKDMDELDTLENKAAKWRKNQMVCQTITHGVFANQWKDKFPSGRMYRDTSVAIRHRSIAIQPTRTRSGHDFSSATDDHNANNNTGRIDLCNFPCHMDTFVWNKNDRSDDADPDCVDMLDVEMNNDSE